MLKEILDKIVETNSTIDALRVVEGSYDHDFTTLHLVTNPTEKFDNPFVRTTYPKEWVAEYLLNNYLAIDPVFEHILQHGESIGWHELRQTSKSLHLYKAAAEFGIGQSGYSFVYEDKRGRRSVFSLNSRMEPKVWVRYIEPLIDDFETILPTLHVKAVAEAIAEVEGAPQLTARERECLNFSSKGKSYSEIAIILSLSEHTVRSYLKVARIKLDCVTIAQAVAKAVRMRII